MKTDSKRNRIHTGTLLASVIVWQTWVVVEAFHDLLGFQKMWDDIGRELPWVTRSFLMVQDFTPLLPITTLALSIDILRRKAPSPWYSGVVLLVALAACIALHWWADQAKWKPLLKLLDDICMR